MHVPADAPSAMGMPKRATERRGGVAAGVAALALFATCAVIVTQTSWSSSSSSLSAAAAPSLAARAIGIDDDGAQQGSQFNDDGAQDSFVGVSGDDVSAIGGARDDDPSGRFSNSSGSTASNRSASVSNGTASSNSSDVPNGLSGADDDGTFGGLTGVDDNPSDDGESGPGASGIDDMMGDDVKASTPGVLLDESKTNTVLTHHKANGWVRRVGPVGGAAHPVGRRRAKKNKHRLSALARRPPPRTPNKKFDDDVTKDVDDANSVDVKDANAPFEARCIPFHSSTSFHRPCGESAARGARNEIAATDRPSPPRFPRLRAPRRRVPTRSPDIARRRLDEEGLRPSTRAPPFGRRR